MFKQKKGALFHWIIFGVLAAFAFFFVLTPDVDTGLQIKGEWQTGFLKNYFYPEEKVMQEIETSVTNFARNSIITLANNGGYLKDSECGKFQGKNLWNNNKTFCFPNGYEEIQAMFSTKNWSGISYNLSFEGEELIGTANQSLRLGVDILLKKKVIDKIGSKSAECLLNPGHYSVFNLNGQYSGCDVCKEEKLCLTYTNQFYCDVDSCNVGCVSKFTKGKEYLECGGCPEDGSCEDYINQYYCSLDPCNLGCSWDINSCVNGSAVIKTWQNDMGKKLVFAALSENFNSQAEFIIKPHFRIDLGYSFDEYEQLKNEAFGLITKCNQEIGLKSCLEENKPNYWKFGECSSEDYTEEERKVSFCIISPKNYEVIKNNKNLVPVKYYFALDFTPAQAITVSSSEVQTDEVEILVLFNYDETAESYAIYYTDYLSLEGQTGYAREMFDSVPEFLGYTVQIFGITNWQESCSFIEYNQAYLCNGLINYRFNKVDLITKSGSYLFAITSLKEGSESEIKEMITVS